MREIKELDVVALLVDLPEHGLERGDVGTMVEVFASNAHHPSGYTVEFVDEQGKMRALAEITDAAQIVRLHLKRDA